MYWYDILCMCGTHLTGIVSNFNSCGVIGALAAVTPVHHTDSVRPCNTQRCMHCLYCVMRFIAIHGQFSTSPLPVAIDRCLPDPAVIAPLAGAAKRTREEIAALTRQPVGKPKPYIRVIDGEPFCVSECVYVV